MDTTVPTETCLPLYLIVISSHFITINNENWLPTLRSDSGGKVSILGGDASVIVRKDLYVTLYLIPNGYRDRAVSTSKPKPVVFLLLELDAAGSLQKKERYTRRTARSHFVFCCPHRETRGSTQTKKTRYSRTSLKVHGKLTVGFSNIYCKLQPRSS